MEIFNLVITKKCGTRLVNKMFTGHGIECLEKKALELKDEIPFEDAVIEGFIFVPTVGFSKVLQVAF